LFVISMDRLVKKARMKVQNDVPKSGVS